MEKTARQMAGRKAGLRSWAVRVTNDKGWRVYSNSPFPFHSKHTTITDAFRDFIETSVPKNLGVIVEFRPIGKRATGDNTYIASTEQLLRRIGRWKH